MSTFDAYKSGQQDAAAGFGKTKNKFGRVTPHHRACSDAYAAGWIAENSKRIKS